MAFAGWLVMFSLLKAVCHTDMLLCGTQALSFGRPGAARFGLLVVLDRNVADSCGNAGISQYVHVQLIHTEVDID